MIAMILAAGMGERLRPLTDQVPKSLIEVRGKSLLEWHLEAMRDAGLRTVVINLGWRIVSNRCDSGRLDRHDLCNH